MSKYSCILLAPFNLLTNFVQYIVTFSQSYIHSLCRIYLMHELGQSIKYLPMFHVRCYMLTQIESWDVKFCILWKQSDITRYKRLQGFYVGWGFPSPFLRKKLRFRLFTEKKLLNMNMNLYHVHCLTAGRYSLVIYSIGLWRLLNNVIHTFIPITTTRHRKELIIYQSVS